MRRIVVMGLVSVLLVAGCGDDDSAPDSTAPTATTSASSTTTTGGASTTAPADTTTTSAATTTTAPTTTTTTMARSELAEGFGLPAIGILSAPEGGGDRPDLTWEPVEGAVSYSVTVLDPEGNFYWGWSGESAEVPFGGLPRLEPAAAGPRVIPGMTWTVLAVDGDGFPLAAGGPTPLSP